MIAHRILAVLAVVSALGSAGAQTCEPRFRFKFADGGTACLTEFPFFQDVVTGTDLSVARTVPARGEYDLAMPPAGGRCPAANGMVITRYTSPGRVNPDNATEGRSARALRDCQRAVDSAAAASASCRCRIVVEDGSSPFTKSEFIDYVGPAGGGKS